MTDRRVVMSVVVILGAFSLFGLAGTVWLIDGGTPAEMIAIVAGLTGTALGGVTGLLASTRSTPAEPAALPAEIPTEGAPNVYGS